MVPQVPSWIAAMTLGLGVAFACAAGLAGAMEFYHRQRQLPVFVAAGRDPGEAARLIVTQSPKGASPCRGEATSRDGAALLTALAWVEGFAHSPIERWLEGLMLGAADRLKIDPPDLSYGPLQIRVSTMRKAMHGGAYDPSLLLQTCAARRVARLIIEQELGVSLGPGSTLTRPQVLAAAAAYNGQSARTRQSAIHRIASRVYQETVYHLFQEARFGQ